MANNEWEELLDEEYERLEGMEDEGPFDEEVCGGEAPTGRHPAGPSSNPAEYFAQEHEEVPASAAERLAKLVDTMPGQTKMLVRILDFCRGRRATDEVLNAVAAWQKLNFSVYEPAVLCGLLEKAGGLDMSTRTGRRMCSLMRGAPHRQPRKMFRMPPMRSRPIKQGRLQQGSPSW